MCAHIQYMHTCQNSTQDQMCVLYIIIMAHNVMRTIEM